MRTHSWFIVVLLLSAGVSFGQSLADVAKKEKERRKNNKGEARVINDQTLTDEGYARSSEGESSTSSTSDESPDSKASGSSINDARERANRMLSGAAGTETRGRSESGSPAEAERAREKEQAIAKLEGHLRSMRGAAMRLQSAAMRYQQNCTGSNSTVVCDNEANELGRAAVAVGRMLNEAQNLARTSRLTPGEFRDLREKHGLDHHVWDAAVRFAAKYGR